MCVSHGVVEVICPVPFAGCVGSASHLWSKSQGRTGGGSWLLDDRPDGVREPRYNDEVILVGVPAAQPFPGLGWGRPAIWSVFKVSRISREAGGTDELGLTCGRMEDGARYLHTAQWKKGCS